MPTTIFPSSFPFPVAINFQSQSCCLFFYFLSYIVSSTSKCMRCFIIATFTLDVFLSCIGLAPARGLLEGQENSFRTEVYACGLSILSLQQQRCRNLLLSNDASSIPSFSNKQWPELSWNKVLDKITGRLWHKQDEFYIPESFKFCPYRDKTVCPSLA